MPSSELESVWKRLDINDGPSARRYHSGVEYLNKFWIFGGFRGKNAFLNDLWQLDVESKQWKELNLKEKLKPAPRGSHSAVVWGCFMFVFGGLASDGFTALNDFWKFDFVSQEWTQLESKPAPRYHHAHVVIPLRKSFLIIGGSETNKKYQSDIWEYKFELGTWHKLHSDDTLNARAGQLLMFDDQNQKLHMFGGYSGDGGFTYHQDGYVCDITAECTEISWRKVDISGMLPYSARQVHPLCHNGQFYVFGGYDGKSPSGEFLVFNPKSSRWSMVKLWMEMDMVSVAKAATNNGNPRPTPRYGHANMIWKNTEGFFSFLIFGGTGSMYLDDTIEIEIPQLE